MPKFEGPAFKYDNNFLKLLSKSSQIIRFFWSKTQSSFVLHETSHVDKFEGTDIKYENSFFKLQSKSSQRRIFWPQNKY